MWWARRLPLRGREHGLMGRSLLTRPTYILVPGEFGALRIWDKSLCWGVSFHQKASCSHLVARFQTHLCELWLRRFWPLKLSWVWPENPSFKTIGAPAKVHWHQNHRRHWWPSHWPHAQCYRNRNLFVSIQLQAVCDHAGRFIDVFVGFPGSVQNTRVLRYSHLYRCATYPPPGTFLLNDGGYDPPRSGEACFPHQSPVRGVAHHRLVLLKHLISIEMSQK